MEFIGNIIILIWETIHLFFELWILTFWFFYVFYEHIYYLFLFPVLILQALYSLHGDYLPFHTLRSLSSFFYVLSFLWKFFRVTWSKIFIVKTLEIHAASFIHDPDSKAITTTETYLIFVLQGRSFSKNLFPTPQNKIFRIAPTVQIFPVIRVPVVFANGDYEIFVQR